MNGIPVKIPCGRRFMPDNSPWVLARPVSSKLTARTTDRPIVRQNRNHEGFGLRHDVPTQKILKAFLQDLEDCPRLFILTCSPALEGTSVTPPARSSGSWFTLVPAPSRRRFRHRCLLLQQRQVTDLAPVATAGFVPIYSGGTARDSHPLPFDRRLCQQHNRRARQSLSRPRRPRQGRLARL